MEIIEGDWCLDPQINLSPKILRLKDILPQIGKERLVYINTMTLPKNHKMGLEPCFVLWMPPLSGNNGWLDQPRDLPLSRIIKCTLKKHVPNLGENPILIPNPHENHAMYEAQIINSYNFIDFCEAYEKENTVAFKSDKSIFERAHHFYKIEISKNIIYLEVCMNEHELCFLISFKWDGVFLKYCEDYCSYSWEEINIINYKLDSIEEKLFREALNTAKVMDTDMEPGYIIE